PTQENSRDLGSIGRASYRCATQPSISKVELGDHPGEPVLVECLWEWPVSSDCPSDSERLVAPNERVNRDTIDAQRHVALQGTPAPLLNRGLLCHERDGKALSRQC